MPNSSFGYRSDERTRDSRLVESDLVYGAVNYPLLAYVPSTAKRILDVGCGTGSLGHVIKRDLDCHVIGITNSQAEAPLAREHLDQVLVCDLNRFDVADMGFFDCIICSHVLEHLYQPEELLKRLRARLSFDGILIVALPNVLFWRQRIQFVLGAFRYTDGGLMDRTHYRFYDWATAQALLALSGYSVIGARADGSFPLSRCLSRLGRWLDRAAVSRSPGLFGFQFIFACRPRGN